MSSFIPSPSFIGYKEGYVFTRRNNKQGYYIDGGQNGGGEKGERGNKKRKGNHGEEMEINSQTNGNNTNGNNNTNGINLLKNAEEMAKSKVR